MKTIINKFFLASAVVMSLTACSDFLDKEPLSQGTEAIVFKTPEHFEQAANALYNVIGWKNLDNKPSYGDIMDRGTDISGLGSNGGGSASEGNWSWDKPYSHIRTCNILLEKAELMMVAKVILPSLWGLLIFFAHGSIFICCNILVVCLFQTMC